MLPLTFPVNLKLLQNIKSVFKTGVCVKSHALNTRKLSLEKTNITFPPEKNERKFKKRTRPQHSCHLRTFLGSGSCWVLPTPHVPGAP